MENKQKGFLQRIGQMPKAAKGALLSLPVIGALSGGAQAAQNQPPADPPGITQIAQAEASDPLIAEAHSKRTQILEKQGLLKMSKEDYDKYFKKGEVKQSETANNCYALTAIDALQHSPQMEIMARSSMKRNPDGSWDVHLPLMNDEGEVTKVTPKEMGRQANPYYMQSDSRFPGGKDTRKWLEPPDSPEGIRALEAAMIKKKFGTDENGSVRRDKAEFGFPMDALDEIGGDNFKKNQIKSPTREVVLPTGEKIDALTKFSYGTPEKQAEVDNFLDKFNPNSDIAVAASTRLPLHDNQDGNLLNSHAYSIRDTDPAKKTVTLADPRDTSKEFTVSYKKFKDNFATIQSIRPDNTEILKNMDNIRQYNKPGRTPAKSQSPAYSPQNPADQIGSIPPSTAASLAPASGSAAPPASAYKTPQTEFSIMPTGLDKARQLSTMIAGKSTQPATSPARTSLTEEQAKRLVIEQDRLWNLTPDEFNRKYPHLAPTKPEPVINTDIPADPKSSMPPPADITGALTALDKARQLSVKMAGKPNQPVIPQSSTTLTTEQEARMRIEQDHLWNLTPAEFNKKYPHLASVKPEAVLNTTTPPTPYDPKISIPIPPSEIPSFHWHSTQNPASSTEEVIISSYESGNDSAPQSSGSDNSPAQPVQPPAGTDASRAPFQRSPGYNHWRNRSNRLPHRKFSQRPDGRSNNPEHSRAEKLAKKMAERFAKQAIMNAARAAAAAIFNALIAILPWLFIILIVLLFFIIIIYYLSGKPIGGSASCINTSTESIAGGASSGLTLSHNDALNELTKAGANIVSSGNCSDKTNKTCTSLDGMRADTIATAVDLAKKSGGTITVTGGTETGHAEGAESHGSGSKIDIGSADGRSDKASQYIRSNYNYVGSRKGAHGGPIYEDPATGNQYVYETGLGHWDITVKSAPPGTATAESTVPGADTGTGTDSTTGTTQTAGTAIADPCAPPPSSEDCNERYASYMQRNPHDQSNFGDPQCDFTKEGLKIALEGVLPPQTADLFYRVAGRESSYIPVIWTNSVGNVATPNSFGAWGLYQMGSRLKSNNQYDRGDVIWRWQATNAVGYLRLLKGAGWRYWQAWRDLAGNTNYPI